jgi:hypothetical protein
MHKEEGQLSSRYPIELARFILIFAALNHMGCGKNEPRKRARPVSNAAAPLQAPTPQVHNPTAPEPKAPAAKTPRIKRDILVGGCLATCEDPLRAVRGFLDAAFRKDLTGLRTHVNTARLVYNGSALGETWAEQYLQGDLAARRESIDKWLKSWVKWVDHIIDPAERRLIDEAILVREQNQRQLLVQYRPPDRASNSKREVLGPQWLLTLKPRGLEWLVTEINDRPMKRRNQPNRLEAKMR